VTKRSLEAWLMQLAQRDDRRAAAESPREADRAKTNEMELGGTREAT
jgi:hypothetical protein